MTRTHCLAALIAALAVTLGSFALIAAPAAAGIDLSGGWEARYSLSCNSTFTQTGTTLSAMIDCGEGLSGTLTGAVDANGAFSLDGSLSLIPAHAEGSVSSDGMTLRGSWSAPPIVPAGSFTASRAAGSPDDLSGDWSITIVDAFAGGCRAEITHSGNQLTGQLTCGDYAPTELEGTYDASSRHVTLSGPFPLFFGIVLEGTVAEDGATFSGDWHFDLPGGLFGTFIAIRLGDVLPPAITVTPRAQDEAATPTATVAKLPDAGSAAGSDGGFPMATVALGVAVAGTALLVLGRRLARSHDR